MNLLFFVVAAMLLGFGYYGYKKGLVWIIFSLFSLVVSIVLSAILTPYISSFLAQKTELRPYLVESCTQIVETNAGKLRTSDSYLLPSTTEGSNPEGARELGEEAGSVKALVQEQHIPKWWQSHLEESIASSEATVKNALAEGMADLILSAIAFVITLIIIRVVLWGTLRMLKVVTKLPIIHGINQMAGLIFGFAEGILIVWIFFLFLTSIYQTPFGQGCLRMVSESRLLSLLFEYNILTLFLK